MNKVLLIIAILAFSGLSANAQWQRTNFDTTWVLSMITKGNIIFAGTNYDIFSSSDNGNNWNKINTGIPDSTGANALALSGNNILAGINSNTYPPNIFGYGLLYSPNNGNNWYPTSLEDTIEIVSLAVKGDTIIAGSNAYGIFLSGDNGNSWTTLNNGLPSNPYTGYYKWVNCLTIKGDTFFAGIPSFGIFRFIPGGNNWTAMNNGLPINPVIYSFALSGNKIFAGIRNGLYESSNNGNNWIGIDTLIYEVDAITISGNNIFLGTIGGGVYWSSNYGNTWTTLNTGLDANVISALAITGNYIFAGTNQEMAYNGIWRLSLSELGIKESNNNEINISIYPNPTTTTLTIETPIESTIKISNIEGQLIKTLAASGTNTNVDHVGYSSYVVDVSTVPCGVYFIEVKTEKGIAVKKFVKE